MNTNITNPVLATHPPVFDNCDKYKQTINELYIVNQKCSNDTNGKYIYSVFHIMMSISAIYLSMRCNKGNNWGAIIFAFFFPYIYIIYSIISNQGICEK